MYLIFCTALTVFVGYIGAVDHNPMVRFERFVSVASYLFRVEIFIGIFDGFCLAAASFYVFYIPKVKCFDDVSQAKFELEKEWFFTRLLIFLFMAGTWTVEFIAWKANNQYEVFLIADALKLLCSITIFTIFITKRNVQVAIIRKYSSLRNKSENLSFNNHA